MQFVDIDFFTEAGWSPAELLSLCETLPTAQNAYHSISWNMKPFAVITDKPRGTATRAPGTTQGHAIIENLMEHMASKLGVDPIEFRMKNFIKEGDNPHFSHYFHAYKSYIQHKIRKQFSTFLFFFQF